MKLSKNRSSLQPGSGQERASDGSFRSSSGLFRVILHSFLCIAAIVLGFRLSGETRFVAISLKPADYGSFSNGIFKSIRSPSVGAEIDDRKVFTTNILSESPPSATLKSRRVHVGRHEILIRSWPHPDPVQILAAHQLIERVQQEQQKLYGVQDQKLVVVVTPTYVRALQAVYLSCLIHTLRIAPGPLVWIVVEAGGRSNETGDLLSQSKLLYYHLAIQEPMATDSKDRKELEIQLRLEGLRFVRDHHLDGVVIFVDDSSTLDLKLFDVARTTDWLGTFSVGLLSLSEASSVLETGDLQSANSSMRPRDADPDIEIGSFGAMNVSSLYTKYGSLYPDKKDLPSKFSVQLMGPVCSLEGRIVGWYAPSDGKQKQSIRPSRKHEWARFAFNSRMFWDDVSKPTWIKSWSDLLVENGSMLESPLGFLWNNSYIEPLGDCGHDIMVWLMEIETNSGCKFPSRWMVSPALELVVPSRRTPWSAKILVDPSAFRSSPSPPPPPSSAHLLMNTTTQRAKGSIKRAKPRRVKHRSHNTKASQVKWTSESNVGNELELNAISTE